MNSIMTTYWPTFERYQAIRSQVMDTLTDADLVYSPGGENAPLGALCVEIGETEHAYIESLKTFRCDFSYRNPDRDLGNSVERLKAWYAELDRDLRATVNALTDTDIQTRAVDRGGWSLPPNIQLDVYKEALLIFYGKVSVYFKALSKPRPQQMIDWIA